MPMVIADARNGDHPIVLANQAFLDLTGYGPDEVVGRNCRFLQRWETSKGAIAEIRAAVGEGQECDVEILNDRKDGSAFWNQLHLSPVRDETGQLLYIFATQRDVTESRKIRSLEAAEHRLLREVDHRAMNALAIVEGIVRLTRADNPSSVRRRYPEPSATPRQGPRALGARRLARSSSRRAAACIGRDARWPAYHVAGAADRGRRGAGSALDDCSA
ncbi:MAG: PAS domain-containing protein [Gemmatimonadaceae bacterium]|nr:PAS domain-containing protein [Caulobacter sp.]